MEMLVHVLIAFTGMQKILKISLSSKGFSLDHFEQQNQPGPKLLPDTQQKSGAFGTPSASSLKYLASQCGLLNFSSSSLALGTTIAAGGAVCFLGMIR